MRWVRDATGRLPHRPHFEPHELDQECEALVTRFLHARYGAARYPLGTNDLTILVERETDDLDLYADLGAEKGVQTEGVTEFRPGERPNVRIARELSEHASREHRLRTTLAHELGHVKFHSFLWTFEAPAAAGGTALLLSPRCRRSTILDASAADWLEWQAGYACGAILMPAGPLDRLVQEVLTGARRPFPLPARVPAAATLIRRVQQMFQVSADAARVRLLKLGYLTTPRHRRASVGPRPY
ncbi:MAG: ImmA/IrrE family metallo-endopeptidase [Chloroflexota bacterium]